MSRPTPAWDTPELVDLIDQLEKLLNDSELTELEVEAGGTGLLLRKRSALGDWGPSAPHVQAGSSAGRASTSMEDKPQDHPPTFRGHVVAAPLTGLYYDSPSPGAEPYVREGGQVNVGQVIGLIEAMKLFNEIKSDMAGRVVRIHAEAGALVKARQALIEIERI